MLKFTSNVIFLIILATFFIVLFLNYQFNLGYTKEDFSGFSSAKTDYKSETSLKTLVPDENIYYDPINANVIQMDSNKVKVLYGESSVYNIFDMTVPVDVEAINRLPQKISLNRKTYCYEVVKDEQYLVYIPTGKNTFIHIINVDSDDYLYKNSKLISVNDTALKSIMTEKDTLNFRSLDNSNKLFMPSPTCVLYLDGDNIRIMSLAKNEAKIFNKNDKTNIINFIQKYKHSDPIESGGICILYEIIPQEKYLFYWARGEADCLTVIDVNRSVNAITNPEPVSSIATPNVNKLANISGNSTMKANAPAIMTSTATAIAPVNTTANAPAIMTSNAPAIMTSNAPAIMTSNAPAIMTSNVPAIMTSNTNTNVPVNTNANVPVNMSAPMVTQSTVTYDINEILNNYPNFKTVFLTWYNKIKSWQKPFGNNNNGNFSTPTKNTKNLLSWLINDPSNYQQELKELDQKLKDNKDTDGSKTKPLVVKDINNYMDMNGNGPKNNNINNVTVNLAMTSSIYQM